VLAHAAKAQSDAFASAVQEADARVSLAREAFYIDCQQASCRQAALQRNLSGVMAADGGWLASRQSGAVREPLFHKVSVDADGGYLCKVNEHARTRAFWSIDAAFALVLSVAMLPCSRRCFTRKA